MAHTVTRGTFPPTGRQFNVVGHLVETVTDITWSGATASETVTAAELGLTSISSISQCNIVTGVASATGVEAAPSIAANGSSVTISLNTATGAGTGQAGTVVRVTAKGSR
jgi:hypothetical protein